MPDTPNPCDPSEQQARQDRLDAAYAADGRHDPTHPQHALYSGLMPTNTLLQLQLTEDQLDALRLLVEIVEDRFGDYLAHENATKSELDALATAKELLAPFGRDNYDPRDERIDRLWEEFWQSADTDYRAWANGEPEAQDDEEPDQPLGWPAFRDAGLAAAGVA